MLQTNDAENVMLLAGTVCATDQLPFLTAPYQSGLLMSSHLLIYSFPRKSLRASFYPQLLFSLPKTRTAKEDPLEQALGKHYLTGTHP